MPTLKSAENKAVPDEECLLRARFESFYRGWGHAGIGRPCRPPALLSEDMKRAYVEGYRARKAGGNVGVPVKALKSLGE